MIDVIRDLRDLTEITEYFRSLHNGSSIITTEEGKVIFDRELCLENVLYAQVLTCSLILTSQ